MKTKAIITAVLLSATNMIWAAGGQSIDTVDVSNIVPTKAEVTKITVQGPIDQFNTEVKNDEKIDTSSLQQSYNGNS